MCLPFALSLSKGVLASIHTNYFGEEDESLLRQRLRLELDQG